MTAISPDHRTGRMRAIQAVRTAGFTLALVASLAATAPAATYYVDNQSASCSNSGAGTEAQPYCTISAAVAARKGADITIIVKPGIYREQVTIPASGAAALPYVLRAQGPGVVVDGSDSFANTGLWVGSTGTVWLASSVGWGPLQVYVDGARLTPAAVAPDLLPVNAFTWVGGQGLYVNLGGSNPGSHQTLVGRRSYGFNVSAKSWVTIEGFEVTHTESRGIYIQSGCSDLVVARNRVSFTNSYGIQINGGLRILVDQNTISDCNYHGIGLTAGTTSSTVRENESFRNADPAVRRANGIYLHAAPGNTLIANRLHDNQDSGVNFVTGTNDCIAYNNRSWNNGDHGFDHLNATGTIHSNDVASGNYKDGFSIEGNSPNTQLYNCVAVENGVTSDEFNLWVNDSSAAGFVSDHNVFWNSTAQNPIKFIDTQYATLAEYRAVSGQDAHSYQADPRFVNGAAGDFRLLAGSPAIDAGHSGAPQWPAIDALGNARVDDPATADHGAGPVLYADIGALEFAPAPPPLDSAPVVSAPTLVAGSEGVEVVINMTASDADGPAITSLIANTSGLPAGNNAQFTRNATNTAGTLRWTPTYTDSGAHVVSFVATNTLTGTASTTIRVVNVDRAPVVTSPSLVKAVPGGTVTFSVTASDPDGDAIASLTMVPVTMPANHGATFVPNATMTAGTFTWVVGSTTGNFKVQFHAANAMTGTATTQIQVKRPGRKDLLAWEDGAEVTELAFSNGFPNPSAAEVEFALDLPQAATVHWAIFDLQGRMVWSEERTLGAGRVRLRWDGMTFTRQRAATGVYLVRASVDGTAFTRRVIRF